AALHRHVLWPAGFKRAAITLALERFLGIDAEQAQRAVEAVDANRVAVGDLGDAELAEDETRRLELEQRLLRGLTRVAIVMRAPPDDREGSDDCETLH